jgi:kinesin family protein 5
MSKNLLPPNDGKNVRVFCRFRPLNSNEVEKGAKKMIRFDSSEQVYILPPYDLPFQFDHIFEESSTQEQVYSKVARGLIQEVLAGYNCTVFAYGQSGSGKTTTMTGYSHVVDNSDLLCRDDVVLWQHPRDMGVVPRMIADLFSEIKTQKDHEFSIQLSYVEVYLEKIRDLLNISKENLEIRENKFKGVLINDVTEVYVSSFDDAIKTMRKGELNRTVAATAMNSHSSRSHSVLIVNLHKTNTKTLSKVSSRMVFVDLAGSEKVEKTKVDGILMKQAQATNKSLLTLGLVIRALVEKKSHVPYRDSKLTRLLTDSLGGNSKTHLIITCSSAQYNIEETVSTLRFGSVTSLMKNKPRVNLEMDSNEYRKLIDLANEKIASQQMMIDSLQKENQRLTKLCWSHGIKGTEETEDGNETEEKKKSPFVELQEKYQLLVEEIQKAKEEIEAVGLANCNLSSTVESKTLELESKILEFEAFKKEQLLLEKNYERMMVEITPLRETRLKLLQEKSTLEQENELLQNRVSKLLEDTQSLREKSLRSSADDHSVSKNSVLQSVTPDENVSEVKQQLEGKLRHISILEESLEACNSKIRDLTSESKKKSQEYERKIKDLLSQIRIMKTVTPPSNIVVPLKY